MNPRKADTVIVLELMNGAASFNHAAGDFMSEDERQLRNRSELGPISIRYMQIRMTNAASFHLNEDVARLQRRTGNILKRQRFLEFM